MNIKDLVKDGKKVSFLFYQKGELWYETECGFKFSVPIEDTGDGRFLATDKAMIFMRYIRKQIQANEEGKSEPKTIGELADEYPVGRG